MPFREKTAWISLLTMLGVFGVFFGGIVAGRVPSHGMATFHSLILSVVALIALQLALKLLARFLARADAASPKDEREQLIELKATRIAFYVLIAGVLGGNFFFIHTPLFGGHHGGPSQLALVTVGAVVLSDLVKSAAQIIFFRRGA
jgi:uncharacterized membrane protein YfcA